MIARMRSFELERVFCSIRFRLHARYTHACVLHQFHRLVYLSIGHVQYE